MITPYGTSCMMPAMMAKRSAYWMPMSDNIRYSSTAMMRLISIWPLTHKAIFLRERSHRSTA